MENNTNNVNIGPINSPLRKIDGNAPSTQATQAHTFAEGHTLGEVQRRGVSQTTQGNLVQVTATTAPVFAENPIVTDAAGRNVPDAASAKDSNKIMIGDLEMSLGNARHQNLVRNENGSIVLTEEGRQLMLSRANGMLGQLESESIGPIHTDNHRMALRKLDAQTAGKFTSYLPQFLADHVNDKPLDHEAVNFLAKKTGLDGDFMRNLISQIATEGLDTACRKIGDAEGMSGQDVWAIVRNASANTKRQFLTSAAMGDADGCHQIIKALRSRTIR